MADVIKTPQDAKRKLEGWHLDDGDLLYEPVYAGVITSAVDYTLSLHYAADRRGYNMANGSHHTLVFKTLMEACAHLAINDLPYPPAELLVAFDDGITR
jgi:hypothetical protein